MGANEFFTGTTSGQKVVDFFNRSVEHSHGKAFVFHIQYEVFAHDGQTDQSDVC